MSAALEEYKRLTLEFHRLMDTRGEEDWYARHVSLMDRCWNKMGRAEQLAARAYIRELYEKRVDAPEGTG